MAKGMHVLTTTDWPHEATCVPANNIEDLKSIETLRHAQRFVPTASFLDTRRAREQVREREELRAQIDETRHRDKVRRGGNGAAAGAAADADRWHVEDNTKRKTRYKGTIYNLEEEEEEE